MKRIALVRVFVILSVCFFCVCRSVFMMGERKREYVYDERERRKDYRVLILHLVIWCVVLILHLAPFTNAPPRLPLPLPPFLLPLLLSSPISTTRKEQFSLIWTSLMTVCSSVGRLVGLSVIKRQGISLIKIAIVGNKHFLK